jgi:hypothetical protein
VPSAPARLTGGAVGRDWGGRGRGGPQGECVAMSVLRSATPAAGAPACGPARARGAAPPRRKAPPTFHGGFELEALPIDQRLLPRSRPREQRVGGGSGGQHQQRARVVEL